MSTVFLSYRKSDTAGEVGHLSDSLKQKLGGEFVFRDVEDIQPGAPFEAVLDKQLDAAKVVLVLIGPTWSAELAQRLKQPGTDYVRLEVATALAKGKRVIPILLRGGTLPAAETLPENLSALAKRQAMTIRDEAWSSDLDRLADAIGRPYRWGLLAIRALMALVAIVTAVWALAPWLFPERANDYAFLRGLVFSLVGVYVMIELLIGYRYLRKLKRGYLP